MKLRTWICIYFSATCLLDGLYISSLCYLPDHLDCSPLFAYLLAAFFRLLIDTCLLLDCSPACCLLALFLWLLIALYIIMTVFVRLFVLLRVLVPGSWHLWFFVCWPDWMLRCRLTCLCVALPLGGHRACVVCCLLLVTRRAVPPVQIHPAVERPLSQSKKPSPKQRGLKFPYNQKLSPQAHEKMSCQTCPPAL